MASPTLEVSDVDPQTQQDLCFDDDERALVYARRDSVIAALNALINTFRPLTNFPHPDTPFDYKTFEMLAEEPQAVKMVHAMYKEANVWLESIRKPVNDPDLMMMSGLLGGSKLYTPMQSLMMKAFARRKVFIGTDAPSNLQRIRQLKLLHVLHAAVMWTAASLKAAMIENLNCESEVSDFQTTLGKKTESVAKLAYQDRVGATETKEYPSEDVQYRAAIEASLKQTADSNDTKDATKPDAPVADFGL